MTRTDGPTGTRVIAALETLAERRISGILEIDGNPGGIVYLDQGQITFARASWIPDLGARLLGTLRLSAASRDLIVDPDRPDRDIGTVLVQRNYLSRGALQAILRSVVVDAALALMVPMDQDAFVSDIRFAASGAHWAGAFSRLDVDFVRSEAIKRAERMAGYNLARTTLVRLRDLGGPPAVLSREQWAVACVIDGTLSVQGLAWQCGLALYDTIECVAYLIQAGLCAPAPAKAAPSLPAPSLPAPSLPAPSLPAGPRVLSPTAVVPPAQPIPRRPVPAADPYLPRRTPWHGDPRTRPVMSAQVWATDIEPPGGGDPDPRRPELLRRVLDGLRNLG